MTHDQNMYENQDMVDRYAAGEFRDLVRTGEVRPNLRNELSYFLNYIFDNVPKRRSILDAGCATANIGKFFSFSRNDLYYYGADLSLPMLQKARKTHGPMRLVNADINHLPFRENSIQYVVCMGTLWYMDDVVASLEALYRVASRALITEIMFLPEHDEGMTTYHEVNGLRQKVRLLGNAELVRTLSRLERVHKFKDLRQKDRFKHYLLNPDKAGLPELKDERIQGFLVVLEKMISAPLKKIFANAPIVHQADEQPDPVPPAQEQPQEKTEAPAPAPAEKPPLKADPDSDINL